MCVCVCVCGGVGGVGGGGGGGCMVDPFGPRPKIDYNRFEIGKWSVYNHDHYERQLKSKLPR